MENTKKFDHYWQTAVSWGYLVLAVSGFIVLAVLAYQKPYLPFDPSITLWLQSYHPAWFTDLMVAVSWPGYMPEAALIVAGFALLVYLKGCRIEALFLILVEITSELLNFAVKIAVHQPRPGPDLVRVDVLLTSFSFPSGHVMFFLSFFGFLWFVIFKRLKRSWLRSLLLTFFAGLIVLVGISRIYLGEHWFSDVLAAYLLASVILLVAICLYNHSISRPHP